MNIVHFIPNNGIGGLQKLCIELAEQQINRYDIVEVVYVKGVSGGHSSKEKLPITPFSILNILKLLRLKSPVIVHTHGNILTKIGWIGFFKKNIKVIHTVHNESNYEAGKYRRIIHSLYFKFGLVSPVVIANSLTKDFTNAYSMQPFGFVLNGIKFNAISDKRIPTPNKGEFNLLFLGRLDYQKNINILLQALDFFCNTHPEINIKLHVGGVDGGYYDKVLFSELEHKGLLKYYGLVNDVHPLLLRCDCLCLCSNYEGLPLVAIEAKLHGLQVVSLEVGGIADIMEDNDVLLPRTVSPKIYAEAIYQAFLKVKNQSLSTLDFSIERVEYEYSKIYSKALHNTNN